MTDVRPFWETVVSIFDRLHAESIRSVAIDHRNAPVLDRSDPRKHGPGVETFRAVAREHLVAATRTCASRGIEVPPGAAIPIEVIDRLAYYSGGVRRSFLSMMVHAAGEAWRAQVMAIGEAIVDAVLLDARRAKEMLIDSEKIALLERVLEDPTHALPPGPLARKLVAEERLLVYEDDDALWCYPNPLLTLVLLEPWRKRARPQGVCEHM